MKQRYVFALALSGALIISGPQARAGDAAAEGAFISRARQMTFEGLRAGEGYFSPDGKKIVFQSEREAANPFYQIYVLDLESGDTHRVSPGTGKTTCAYFRPGSGKVIFASTHLDPESEKLQKAEIDFRASGKEKRYSWDYDEHYDIFEANEDGTAIKRLTDARGYDAEGSCSPDGTKIAFTSMRSAYPAESLGAKERKLAETDLSYFGEIYIMNADGSGQTRLTNSPGYDGGPFFTPDGERIVWRRFDEMGAIADIYTMKLDGSDVRRLTDFKAMSWAPFFHPSGDYAIFASNKLGFGNFELFIVDARGEKDPVRVTFTDGFDGLPVFTPDGKSLCWTTQRAGGKGGQLFMGAWNDAHAREALAAAPARGSAPTAEAGDAHGAKPAAHPALPVADSKTAPEISEEDLKAEVAYLASEALEGRATGEKGERLAADRIKARFEKIGLVPLPGADGFEEEFTFTSGVVVGKKNSLERVRIEANPHKTLAERVLPGEQAPPAQVEKDFRPLAFSDDGSAEGVLAFVGYGLVVPGESGAAPVYDSYDGVDVKGKVVLLLRWAPEELPQEKRMQFNRYAGLRYKALQARERGAVAMLVVSGPKSPMSGELVPLGMDMGGSTSGILAASVTIEQADALLAPSGKTIGQLQASLDSGESKSAFAQEDVMVRLSSELEKKQGSGRNVAAMLPPTGGMKPETEFVVVGAHYDHLGRGGFGGNSLATKEEAGLIHHGADDNASGVAAMLEIAESMAASKAPRERAVVFAAWSGEEIGLLGSSHFCKKPSISMEKTAAYLNMDMVGRVKENKLVVQGVGSSKDWRAMIEKKNVPAGFALSLTDDPYLPTDSTSFYAHGVPGLHFFSGSHSDYHRPSDTAEKINYEGLARAAKFVESFARDLAKGGARPAYAKVENVKSQSGGRDSMRAYLGTIPDYANEGIEGVLLSGVGGGGPADKAGVKSGDIIVELGGQKIKNIYDYTFALEAVKIDVPVKLVVVRKNEKLELTVTPTARK